MARLLKLPEVAQRLEVSEKTARRYVKAGILPSAFVGNAYRVNEEDVEEYLRRAKVEVGGNTPKAQAPPPPESEEKAWRRGEFLIQLLSDEERIKLIEKAVDILRHYYELGQRERAKMDEGMAWHGLSYVWHGFYYSAIQPAMERDGTLMYASFVVGGPAEVSESERTACEKILDFDRKMGDLLWDMRDVDNKNNARAREDGSQLTAETSSYLEEISREAASRRGPEEE